MLQITFDIDADSTLTVIAKELSSDKKQEYRRAMNWESVGRGVHAPLRLFDALEALPPSNSACGSIPSTQLLGQQRHLRLA